MKQILFKKAILSIVLLISSQYLIAQNAYIYIENIKGMPISATLNGTSVKSLAKNYLLFETNQEGENAVELRFAGDLYPPQNFIINVVHNASYGFKMAKANEDKFYLLDLVNNGKIIELNTTVNFAFSTEENNIHFYNPKNYEMVKVNPKNNSFVKNKKKKKEVQKEIEKNIDNIIQPTYGIVEVISSKTENDTIVITKIDENNTPKKKKSKKIKVEKIEPIIEDTTVTIAQNNEVNVNEEVKPKAEKQKKKSKKAAETIDENEVKNIDNPVLAIKKEEIVEVKKEVPTKPAKCIREASDLEINSFNDKLVSKTDDEAKLILLKKKFFTGCLSVKQLYSITEKFDTQYGRFTVVKFMKPELVDAENLVTLQPLFKYETYKSKLKKLSEE